MITRDTHQMNIMFLQKTQMYVKPLPSSPFYVNLETVSNAMQKEKKFSRNERIAVHNPTTVSQNLIAHFFAVFHFPTKLQRAFTSRTQPRRKTKKEKNETRKHSFGVSARNFGHAFMNARVIRWLARDMRMDDVVTMEEW